jgi:predicted nucleic acid-binding protein
VIVYLDASIIIYLVEQPALWGPRAAARVAALRTAGDTIAISDLARLECRVGPLKSGNTAMLAFFDSFFTASNLLVLGLTAAVCNRAAVIRAAYNFKGLDSLHLAAAVVHGCDRFLTNDTRLNTCADIPVEVLP